MSTIVHVGIHKTGSTTLQNLLAKHRGALAAQGVHYPADPGAEWTAAHRLACWLSAPRAFDGPNDLFTMEREVFSQRTGARDVSTADYLGTLVTDLPATLLSSEVFETFNRAELARLRSFVGPIDRFVLYVRNGIDYLHSCWSAKVRWGYTGTFAGFLRAALDFEAATPIRGPLLFAQLLADCFGHDRIAVRNLATASMYPRGLFGDFVEGELKLEAIEGIETSMRANASPPHEVTEVTRAINVRSASLRPGHAERFHNALRIAMAGPDAAKYLHEFSGCLEPVIKPISIRDLAPERISTAGVIRDLDAPLATLFSGWKFEWDEQQPTCENGELMAALDDCEAFTRLQKETE